MVSVKGIKGEGSPDSGTAEQVRSCGSEMSVRSSDRDNGTGCIASQVSGNAVSMGGPLLDWGGRRAAIGLGLGENVTSRLLRGSPGELREWSWD